MTFEPPGMPPPPIPQQGNPGCKAGCVGCPLLAVGCATLLGLFVAGILFLVFTMIKGSDPYAEGLARARNSREVAEALGTPVEPGWWVLGSLKTQGDSSGRADISFPIAGPKGSGKLYVVGSKSAGRWHYLTIRVDVYGGKSVDLLREAERPEAPPSPSPRRAPSPQPSGVEREW